MTSSRHNSGYADYYELRRAIWDSRESTVVKALALAILEHMRPDKLEAYPSRSRLAEMCSISEKTLERHWQAISQWIDIIKATGRRNVYRARIYACASELIDLMPEKTTGQFGGCFSEPPVKNHRTIRPPVKMTTGQNEEKTTGQFGGSEDLIEDSNNRMRISATKVEDLVDVNCTAITGPGFRMTYAEIDYAALLARTTSEAARAKAALLAHDWARRDFVPKNPISMLQAALRTEELNSESQKVLIKRAIKEIETKPHSTASPSNQLVPEWRRQQQEADEAFRQGIKILREKRAQETGVSS